MKEIRGLSGPGVVGMGYVAATEPGRLLIVHEDGSIKVSSSCHYFLHRNHKHDPYANHIVGIPYGMSALHVFVHQVTNPFIEGDDDQMEEGSDDDAIAGKQHWAIKGPLSCMALQKTTLAAGGKERELGLWDVETHKSIWEARNVAHDKLDLRQSVWVTAISFLDETGQTLTIGTGYKQVRI